MVVVVNPLIYISYKVCPHIYVPSLGHRLWIPRWNRRTSRYRHGPRMVILLLTMVSVMNFLIYVIYTVSSHIHVSLLVYRLDYEYRDIITERCGITMGYARLSSCWPLSAWWRLQFTYPTKRALNPSTFAWLTVDIIDSGETTVHTQWSMILDSSHGRDFGFPNPRRIKTYLPAADHEHHDETAVRAQYNRYWT